MNGDEWILDMVTSPHEFVPMWNAPDRCAGCSPASKSHREENPDA